MNNHETGNPVFDYRASDRRAADTKQALLLKAGALLFLGGGIASIFVAKDLRPVSCWTATAGLVLIIAGIAWGFYWRKRMRAEFREKFGPKFNAPKNPPQQFDDEELKSFIRNYQPENNARIKFDWNGKHSDDFEDKNMEFRRAVIAMACSADNPPILLIRDLFLAETFWAKEAWCIDAECVRQLGAQLLSRGKSEFVLDFLRGKNSCFDSSMCCATIQVDVETARTLHDFLSNTLNETKEDKSKLLVESGIEFFDSRLK